MSKLLITYKITLCVGKMWGSLILTPPKLALLAPWLMFSLQCFPITIRKYYIDVFRNFTIFPSRVFISMRESDTFLWTNLSLTKGIKRYRKISRTERWEGQMENSIVLVRSAIISRLGDWVIKTKDASFLIFRAVLTSTLKN